MKVKREALGMMAEVAWRDPFRHIIKSTKKDYSDIEISEGIFPLQRERGVIIIIRDGIVVISHTQTIDTPLAEDPPTLEHECTFIPEDRIEYVTLYEPRKEGGINGKTSPE